MRNSIKNKIVFISLVVIYFIFPCISSAAVLSLLPSNSSVNVGNIISVKVSLNTEGLYVNNGESTIQFPSDLLEVVSVSRNPSIFSLWVEEPNFSNATGRINFNGGIATPGYNGGSGIITTITFKAKKVGTASVILSDSAIRKNDGLGTDVLNSRNNSTIQITSPLEIKEDPVIPPVSKANILPPKPVVISSTHPDQNTWYSSDTASFNWKVPSGVTKVQTILTKNAISTPTISYDNSVTQKTLSNLSDGTLYFHLRYQNSNGWGEIDHFKINVDSTPPLDFELKIRNEDNRNFVKLDAEDAISGINHYLLSIDSGSPIKVQKSELINEEYLLPILNQGNHNLIVSAYDKAGNYKDAEIEFKSSFVSSPIISLNLQEINKGEAVVVFGETDYPNNQVEIILEYDGNIFKKYTETTSDDGSFSLTTERIKTVGIVSISAENIFSGGVKSKPSEKVFLKVNEPIIVKVTLAVFWVILFLVLVLILIFIAYVGWHRLFGLKNKINSELEHTRVETHKAMLLFKEELSNQLEKLEKIKEDRELNKKEKAIFKEISENIDTIDTFIEKKLKKLL